MANMGIPTAFHGGRLVWVAGLALLLGCRTPTEPPLANSLGAVWHVQQGQAIWHPGRGRPELAGELLWASASGGRSFVEFTKTPFSLVLARRDPGRWRVEFPGAGRRFTGRGTPPTRFLWLYLGPALAGEALPGHLKFERRPDGQWDLQNPRSGESLEGYLTP